MNDHKVFVYGSLKKGFGNNLLLMRHGAKFLGTCMTAEASYNMVSLGSFPAVVAPGSYRILGELYEVGDACLASLDRLEGNGSFYKRELVDIEDCQEKVWVYFLMQTYSTDFRDNVRVAYSKMPGGETVASWQHEPLGNSFDIWEEL